MPPATDWKETIPEGEAARFERYAEQLRELQRSHAAGGPPGRALHAKGQAGLDAQLTVLPDLPEHARVGLFAKPGTYRAYVRYSNGAGRRQRDRKPDVRGIAIKVLGVEGKKIIPGLENATTQDFLLIQNTATPFATADDFVWLVLATKQPALLLPRVIGRFGLIRGLGIIKRFAKVLGKPVISVATSHYFSALPIKFGPYAVHYALRPKAAPDPAATPRTPESLAEEMAARLARGPVEYDFCVQFYCDDTRTPIEDASREWKEEDAPFLTVARLTLPQQSPDSPRGRRLAEFVEGLSFNPWHATEDFRPLGNMMRARNAAYRLSTQERGAKPEPDGTERFD